MDNSDVRNLARLVEDLNGYNTPQYASNSPMIVPAGVGTLKSAYVEVPEDDKEKDQKDDEDQESETPIQKLIDDIKDTIQSYEDKKERREQVDLKLEEGYILNEFVSGFMKGLNQGPTAAVEAGKDFASSFKKDNEEKNYKFSTLIGPKNPPKKGEYIHSAEYDDATAKIVKVIDPNRFQIILMKPTFYPQKDNTTDTSHEPSDYIFVKIKDTTKETETSWVLVNKKYAENLKNGKIKGMSIAVDKITKKDAATINAEIDLNKKSRIKDWYYIDTRNNHQKDSDFSKEGQQDLPMKPQISSASQPRIPKPRTTGTPVANPKKRVK